MARTKSPKTQAVICIVNGMSPVPKRAPHTLNGPDVMLGSQTNAFCTMSSRRKIIQNILLLRIPRVMKTLFCSSLTTLQLTILMMFINIKVWKHKVSFLSLPVGVLSGNLSLSVTMLIDPESLGILSPCRSNMAPPANIRMIITVTWYAT